MSAPKLISPLLDGFVMGPPISSHHGVRCCPAMKHNSDNKYIVKIISVPASQSQLDALLLTGAYNDPGEAMDYFKSLADGVTDDADMLRSVSKLEGFLPYEGYQIVPMEDNRLGYFVYLIGRGDIVIGIGVTAIGLTMFMHYKQKHGITHWSRQRNQQGSEH